MNTRVLPGLFAVIALIISLMPEAQASTPLTGMGNEMASESSQAAPVVGYISVNTDTGGWAVFTDTVYGYAIQYPAPWYTYPANGSLGSVSVLSNYDIQSARAPTDAVRIEIGVAIYDRAPEVSLRNWVAIPSDLASRVALAPDRPSVYTEYAIRIRARFKSAHTSFWRCYGLPAGRKKRLERAGWGVEGIEVEGVRPLRAV